MKNVYRITAALILILGFAAVGYMISERRCALRTGVQAAEKPR